MRDGRQQSRAGDIECSIRRRLSLPAHWRIRSTVPLVVSGASDATSSMTLNFTANLKICTCHHSFERPCWNVRRASLSFFGDCSRAMAIFRPKETRRRVAPRTVAIVRDYLHAKAESQVSIADLAQAAGVSGTQVIRSFSAATGMPPHSYLVSLRVERAKAVLRAGTSPAETALEVGFSDQSQLTRHFKRLTGVTPGRFAAEVSPLRSR